jgi:hypothetical protein
VIAPLRPAVVVLLAALIFAAPTQAAGLPAAGCVYQYDATSTVAVGTQEPPSATTTHVVNTRRGAFRGYDRSLQASPVGMRILCAVLAAKARTPRPFGVVRPDQPPTRLRPGGNAIGRAGASPGIRELDTADELDEVFEVLRVHGSPTTSRYPGAGFDLPGGGFVGRRESKRFGPTLDINIPGIDDIRKIHVRGQ